MKSTSKTANLVVIPLLSASRVAPPVSNTKIVEMVLKTFDRASISLLCVPKCSHLIEASLSGGFSPPGNLSRGVGCRGLILGAAQRINDNSLPVVKTHRR